VAHRIIGRNEEVNEILPTKHTKVSGAQDSVGKGRALAIPWLYRGTPSQITSGSHGCKIAALLVLKMIARLYS
jgi:hypothetical protein